MSTLTRGIGSQSFNCLPLLCQISMPNSIVHAALCICSDKRTKTTMLYDELKQFMNQEETFSPVHSDLPRKPGR